MNEKFIKPDQFYEITMNDDDTEHIFNLSAKYDRLDHFKQLGIWILKILDDEQGLVQVVMEESQALKIARVALLPVIERDFIYQSEHELYIDAIASRLDDIFGD